MKNYINLGEAWGGKNNSDAAERRVSYDANAINLLIPRDVKDDAMKCGGRQALHNSIVKIDVIEERAKLCGKCAVVGCALRII